jgi:hypothetical protein
MQNVIKSRDQNLEYHWVALPLKYLSAKPPKYQPQNVQSGFMHMYKVSLAWCQSTWRYKPLEDIHGLNPKTSKESVLSNPKWLTSKTKIPHQAKTPQKKFMLANNTRNSSKRLAWEKRSTQT